MKLTLIFVLLFASAANAEEIPLDEIWGYDLPGTRDIADIPLPEKDPREGVPKRTPEQFKQKREFSIEQIRKTLAAKPPTERPVHGFVFHRQPDFFTLRGVSELMRSAIRHGIEINRWNSGAFRAGDEMTLVIFTYPLSSALRLEDVQLVDGEITVRYQLKPRTTEETSVHFALIPLGKLPAGEYRVNLDDSDFSFEMWEPTDRETLGTAIPLDQIWALKMPGTQDLMKLDAKRLPSGVKQHPIINEIYASLKGTKGPKEGEKAGPGFMVEGTGKEALEKAAAILAGKEEAKTKFNSDSDLTLVFFSHSSGQFVHIIGVTKTADQIKVEYRFVAHSTANNTIHVALIPLGKLPPGEVQVAVEQVASVDMDGNEQPPIRRLENRVSGPFTLEVVK